MKTFFRNVLSGTLASLLRNVQGGALDLAKIRGAIWYLRAVRTARQLYLMSLARTVSLTLAGVGFVLFHVGLYALLPAPTNAIVLMVLGLLYMIAGLCIIRILTSEKNWMQASGAAHYTALIDKRPRS